MAYLSGWLIASLDRIRRALNLVGPVAANKEPKARPAFLGWSQSDSNL